MSVLFVAESLGQSLLQALNKCWLNACVIDEAKGREHVFCVYKESASHSDQNTALNKFRSNERR